MPSTRCKFSHGFPPIDIYRWFMPASWSCTPPLSSSLWSIPLPDRRTTNSMGQPSIVSPAAFLRNYLVTISRKNLTTLLYISLHSLSAPFHRLFTASRLFVSITSPFLVQPSGLKPYPLVYRLKSRFIHIHTGHYLGTHVAEEEMISVPPCNKPPE
jgi:hypothetical protein